MNKSDQLDRVRRNPWMEKFQLENYIKENQFYNQFYVSSLVNNYDNKEERERESFLSNQSVDIESPLKSMLTTIIQFKDLKEKLLAMTQIQINKNPSIKVFTDNSLCSNSKSIIEEDNIDKKRNKSKRSNCLIS